QIYDTIRKYHSLYEREINVTYASVDELEHIMKVIETYSLIVPDKYLYSRKNLNVFYVKEIPVAEAVSHLGYEKVKRMMEQTNNSDILFVTEMIIPAIQNCIKKKKRWKTTFYLG